MLRNIFLKTLRDYRLSILIWGGSLALLLLVVAQSYDSLFSGPERAKFIAEYEKTANSFSFLVGKTYDLDTVGGFVTSRMFTTLPMLLSIFAILMGSALIRGEEERGSLDLLLSTPHSRRSVLLQKWAGMGAALLSIGLLGWAGLTGGGASTAQGIDAGAAALALLNTGLMALFFGSVALMFGQIVASRKVAAGWAGGIMAGAYLFNNVAAQAGSLEILRYLSPFYYESLSKPLAPSVGVNSWAMLGLGVASLPLAGLALLMYERRDHANVFPLWKRQHGLSTGKRQISEPRSLWLANSFSFGLRAALPGALIWGLGLSVYIAIIMRVFNEIRDSMNGLLNAGIYKNLGFAASVDNASMLQLLLFVSTPVIYAAYAVTLVASWNGEETDGRLELVLSTPQPRWLLLLSRFGVAVVASAIMVGVTGLVFASSAAANNVTVDGGKTIEAFVGLWIICVIIAAAGWALDAFGPGRVVAVLGGLLVVSYLANLLGTLLKLPQWLINLSVFQHYGQPIVSGLDWTPQFVMLSLATALVALATWRFQQRDIMK